MDSLYLYLYTYTYIYIHVDVYMCIYGTGLQPPPPQEMVMVMCVGASFCMSPRSPLWGGVWWGVCIHDKYVIYICMCIYIHKIYM